jgi:uncharacterized protein (AIM24 family)
VLIVDNDWLLGGTGGLFVMETTGRGQILVSAFGDVEKIELDGHSPRTA